MRSQITPRRAARPTAVHLFCALVLGLTGCAGGATAPNAAGQAIVEGVPGAPAVLTPGASAFAGPNAAPTLDVDHPGIAGLDRPETPVLEVAPDVVIATHGELGELGDIARIVAPSPATPPAAPPVAPPAPEEENPTSPPPAPLARNNAEVVYAERYDEPGAGLGSVELLTGEARCMPVLSDDACSLVVCDGSAGARRVFAPFVAFAVGESVHEAFAEDEEQPLFVTDVATDVAESVGVSAYVEGAEGGPVFVTDLAMTSRQASLETLVVGTTGLQPGSEMTVSAPDDLALSWAGYGDGGTLRVILDGEGDRNQYVECSFAPDEGRGSVPASLLDQLGTPDLQVEVASVGEKINLVDGGNAVWTVASRNERVLLDQMTILRR